MPLMNTTDGAVRWLIATRRLPVTLILLLATACAIIVALYPSWLLGEQILTMNNLATMARFLGLPAALATALITVTVAGADEDDHLTGEFLTAGLDPRRRHAIDLACSLALGLLCEAFLALLTATVVTSQILIGSIHFTGTWNSRILRHLVQTTGWILWTWVFAAVVLRATHWSTKRTLTVVGALLTSFFAVLAGLGRGFDWLVTIHPLAGLWRQLYTGHSDRLTVPLTTTTARISTLAWTALLLILGFPKITPRKRHH